MPVWLTAVEGQLCIHYWCVLCILRHFVCMYVHGQVKYSV